MTSFSSGYKYFFGTCVIMISQMRQLNNTNCVNKEFFAFLSLGYELGFLLRFHL